MANEMRAAWDKAQGLFEERVTPRLLVGGKTGVGKSSLLNALLGTHAFEIGVVPTTPDNLEGVWNSAAGEMLVYDTPGFSEAEAKGRFDYDANVKRLIKTKAHIFLLVLSAADRALQVESQWLKETRRTEFFQNVPSLLVVNQIDKLPPIRAPWNPGELNLKSPKTAKEQNICEYLAYLLGLDAFSPFSRQNRLIPVCAGEAYDDAGQYGIEDLRIAIYRLLPDTAKTEFARRANLKKEEGKRIITWYSAGVFAAVAANPIAGSDAAVIVPTQIAMLVHLGRLHGVNMTISAASSMATTLALTFAGRWAASAVIDMVPVLKNFVGPPLAAALTYATGFAANDLFAKGLLTAKQAELKRLMNEGAAAAEKIKWSQ
jgi:small GTP-binding protein